ncbi:hydroxyethylthiazole kinase [Acetobacteraceae bacterium KSS8]|uniref:Hydroxyethylthiazole kinase n=1 Tax=Endosaccharibacter trunci TaxID=2812733 RepID=A0ABT1W3W6_9PROT|nr:hydroxyethylthiazole kinase [Acetobacteraceae bacterium KSS8]
MPIQSEIALDAGHGMAVARTLRALRQKRPLVHSITNLVVNNSTANALLAIGASPAMVVAEQEAAAFARIADSLVINLGTITAPDARAMALAAEAAREAGTPWVMDPVAVGALAYRSNVAVELLAHRPAAIRGNASEILALAGLVDPGAGGSAASGRGVDSAHETETALEAAQGLARRTASVVTVSGAVDLCTDGARLMRIGNGHPMMTRVTGLGCTATALLGACLAVEPDALLASAHATVLIGVAGELAAERSRGPGSLQLELLDALFLLDDATLETRTRLEVQAGPDAAGAPA